MTVNVLDFVYNAYVLFCNAELYRIIFMPLFGFLALIISIEVIKGIINV